MTARLLAVVLVLALLPTGELVASAIGAATADACVTGGKGDICPEHCCPNAAHSCGCHHNFQVARIEPMPDSPPRVETTPPMTWSDQDGRGCEPPPVRPPID